MQTTVPAQGILKSDALSATIETLPPELLLLIFEFCYENFKLEEESLPQLENPPWHYISCGLDSSSMRPSSPSALFERFRSPTRFPFALAAVTPFWEQVLLLQPEWWTEIILYTGPTSSPIGDVARARRSVRSLPEGIPLDFMVLRDRDSKETGYTAGMEQKQLDVINDFLFEIFDQCKSISIEAVFGTSFPDIGCWHRFDAITYDPTPSSLLLAQELNGDYVGNADLGYEYGDKVNHLYEDFFESLVIDGRNLDLMYPIFFTRQRTNLVQLVIFDYRGATKGISVPELLSILQELPNLISLKLKNVEFRHELDSPSNSFTPEILHLHLQSISPLMTRELFRLCTFTQLESMHLTDCLFWRDFPSTELLVLEDLSANNCFYLEATLGVWEGSSLWLGGSRANYDSVIDMLRKWNNQTNEFPCPWMDTLYLHKISVISLKKLKKMLRCRNQRVDFNDPDWRNNTLFAPVIKKLSIDQCGIAPLTEKDVEWFSSRLVEFIYIQ